MAREVRMVVMVNLDEGTWEIEPDETAYSFGIKNTWDTEKLDWFDTSDEEYEKADSIVDSKKRLGCK